MNPQILGHESVRSRFKRLQEKDTLPHALLLSGPAGIGKKLVAIELYQTFFCDFEPAPYGGCKNCRSCKLLAVGSLPQFRVIDCSVKENVSVERMRDLLYELHLAVSRGSRKVLILDNAGYLSDQAQNIILKGLEEPRKDTYFCLVTGSLSRLLPTVQSRCQTWHCNPLSAEQIQTIVRHTPALMPLEGDIDVSLIAKLADGSVENIAQLVQGAETWAAVEEFITCLTARKMHAVAESIKEIKADKQNIRAYLAAMRIIARDRMLAADTPAGKFAWSVFLQNCILAEPLIMERNLSIDLVLHNLALGLLSPSETLPFTSIGNDATILTRFTAQG